MLLILIPVSDVLAAVGMLVNAKALRHIVNKFTLVKIAAGVIELAPTIVEVVLPEPLVHGAVGPPHDAVPLLDVGRILQHLA